MLQLFQFLLNRNQFLLNQLIGNAAEFERLAVQIKTRQQPMDGFEVHSCIIQNFDFVDAFNAGEICTEVDQLRILEVESDLNKIEKTKNG